MWISLRSAISSPFLSTCRAEKHFYTASAKSSQSDMSIKTGAIHLALRTIVMPGEDLLFGYCNKINSQFFNKLLWASDFCELKIFDTSYRASFLHVLYSVCKTSPVNRVS